MGIYDAFDPIETPHLPAQAPPTHGFGMETFKSGRKAGMAGTDWGLHQATFENDILDTVRGELKKKGIEAPYYDRSQARLGLRLRASQAELTPAMSQALEQSTAFWNVVASERKRDPKFMSALPDVADDATLSSVARARRDKDEETAGEVYSRSTGMGKAAWWLGNFAAGFNDPISYIPIGGGVSKGLTIGSKILGTAVREGAINAGVQLALEPLIEVDARNRGQSRDLGDVALDVGFAAALGGVLGVGEAGLTLALSRPKTGRATLDGVVEAIGPENLTPDERAAVHVISRELDIREASPFIDTPEGDKAHGSRLATALAALEDDQPVPEFSRSSLMGSTSTSAMAAGDGAAQFKAMVRTAESGGDDLAVPRDRSGRLRSSATGRYQFTDATWLTYHKRTFPASGLNDAQILAKRADGAVQDRLMDALTQDNSRLLRSAGQEASAANLYMLHFLGPRGLKVLRAADDAPISELLPEEFISANPEVLRGKTAGEVMAWADKKMGGEGAVARSEGDAPTLRPELFDDPEVYRLAQMGDEIPDDAPASLVEGGGQRALAEAPEVLAERASIGARLRSFAERFIPDRSGKVEPIDLAPVAPDTAAQIETAIGVDTAGFTHSADSDAIRHWWNVHGPEGSRIPADGRPMTMEDLDRIPEILASPDVVRQGRPATPQGRTPTITFEKKIGDEFFYVEEVRSRSKRLAFKTFYVRKGDVPRGGDAEAPPRTSETLAGQGNISQPSLEGKVTNAVPEQVVREVESAPPRFSEPNGPDAKMQTDSIIHDLTVQADDDGDLGSYRLGDEGPEASLDEVLASVEADEAAIKAARGCL